MFHNLTITNLFRKTNLPRDERKKGEEAGALDGDSEFALMRSADASATMIADASMWIEEATKCLNIFVINVSDIVVAEVTEFHNRKLNIIN